MLILSCKCLNFIATHAPPTPPSPVATSASLLAEDCNMLSVSNGISGNTTAATTTAASLSNELMYTFLQKYPRNFIFYSQCMDFLKQAIGPIPDLTINAINQRDLIYSLTLNIVRPDAAMASTQAWQLSVCINCNSAIYAKRLNATSLCAMSSSTQYLVNAELLITSDELTQRRSDKSFSETFGLLIMDHPVLMSQLSNGTTNSGLTSGGATIDSSKQQRIRQLQHNLQQRLQQEIAATDDRIQRYTEQQFALLKSFREKSEQEYALLMQLIQRVPEQQISGNGCSGISADWLDRSPPALEVNGNAALNFTGVRRRNTISSRRDLVTPTTPTTITPTIGTLHTADNTTIVATQQTSRNASQNLTTSIQAQQQNASNAIITVVLTTNRKLPTFETPPATPEAIPMSVGNSPTFTQKQQQFMITNNKAPRRPVTDNGTDIDTADDCLFELEGFEEEEMIATNQKLIQSTGALSLNLQNTLQMQLQQRLTPQHNQVTNPHQHRHRQHQYQHNQLNSNKLNDLHDESDNAEEAEDALDLNNSMMYLPIQLQHSHAQMINSPRNGSAAGANDSTMQMINFAKSLPIEIANSPAAAVSGTTSGRTYMLESDDDELDNTVDIAASIKALAKSVHGEAVFGDLPRPRLRSQI